MPPHKRNVNTVFQHYALFPHMTVWDNVAYGPRSKKKDKAEVRKRVDELLEIVRLTDFAQRKPAQLSGGQQQRVALARALVNYPSALLLDEPLGALDLKLRQVMQFELKRIQREVGITFIYVTHDQEEALTMSDRIAVMNAGNVDQIGTPTEIYDRPSTVFVASFIGQANLWAGRQTGRTNRDFVEVEVLGTTLKARPGDTTIEPGGQATLMVRPERVRVSMDAPTGDVATVRATVTDLTFQGPVVRLSLAAPDESTDPRARRPRAGPAAAAARRRGPRLLGARRLAGAAGRRHPDHRGSRGDARRLVTVWPSIRPLPPKSTKGTVAMPAKNSTQSTPQLLSRLATNRTSRRRFIGGGAAAAAALALGPSFLAACGSDNKSAIGTTSDARGRPGHRHAADLELAAVHGRRLRRRVPEGVGA